MEVESTGETPLLVEKQGPSFDAPTSSLVGVDVTYEVSHEDTTSNLPLVEYVSCFDGLFANNDDAMDEGMPLCGDMVLENYIESMANNDGLIIGNEALESIILGFYDVLGQILAGFIVKILDAHGCVVHLCSML